TRDITVDPEDVVIYDAQGYKALKEFLRQNKIRHVLLTGYAADMCYCRTTAGYANLSADFNVFLVGDATLPTFPPTASPRFAPTARTRLPLSTALITMFSWVKIRPTRRPPLCSPGGVNPVLEERPAGRHPTWTKVKYRRRTTPLTLLLYCWFFHEVPTMSMFLA